MTYSIQFVDSIASSPTTRLDLGDGTTWRVLRDGTDFSPPPLRRVIVSSMLQDGARIPSSVYDLRVITLELILDGSTADAAAAQLQTLFRELDRPEGNILRVWENTTNPVFFKTHRASASSVRTRMVAAEGKKWELSVELLAEPFGLGLLQTPVSGATLNTDPAINSYIDVSTVLGDTEAPAIIRWPSSAVTTGRQTLFAIRQRGTPANAPFVFQFENLNNGTDTTDQANASFSNGFGTRTTFATTSMATRSTLSDLGTAGVDLRGRYRVFARYAKTVSGDTIAVQAVWGTSGSVTTTNDSVELSSGTSIKVMDLGLIQIPRGEDTSTSPLTGVTASASDTFHLAIQASRAGSGNLDLDYLLLLPADEKGTCMAEWTADAGPSYWLLDAEKNKPTAWNASDQLASAAPPALTGGLPYLRPGVTNRVYILYEVASSLANALTTVSPVSISYWPRYLRVRPAST